MGEGGPAIVLCDYCELKQYFDTVIEGVSFLAQHTIALHPEIAEISPVVALWRRIQAGEAKLNGHRNVSSQGVF